MSFINKIGFEPIKQYVEDALNTYGDGKPSETAEKVAEVTYALLEDKELVQEHGNQTFVDCLIAAALIHDLFKPPAGDGFYEDWTYIFQARYLLGNSELPKQIQDGIYEAIEAQLGNKTPVIKCRPLPGTPQETFANAVWIVGNYLK